jgi:RND family efflux transporter MFP subunit
MSESKTRLDDLKIERPHPSREGSRGWVIIVIVLLLLALIAAASFWYVRNRPVEVRTVAARDVAAGPAGERTVLNASGYVTARREATVSSKVTGKVVEVLIEEGMRVEAGRVLARLDDTNIRASLDLAEAQLKATQAALAETKVRIKQAERELQRVKSLLQEGINTAANFDVAEAEELALRARLAQQESQVVVEERQVALWRQQLDDTIIRAPFAGIVTSKNAQPGEMISPVSAGGGFTRTGICTIVDMESLEIEIDVNESYINRVTAGQPVEAVLDAYAQWKLPCKVVAIIPTADRQKSTVRVRVGFDKLDPRILPQMSVKVGFYDVGGTKTGATRAVSVPKSVVQQLEGRDVVLIIANGRAERRAVTVGEVGREETTLISGLTPGERVVVDWPAGLTDGVKVKEKSP